jgi:hypothetical protein
VFKKLNELSVIGLYLVEICAYESILVLLQARKGTAKDAAGFPTGTNDRVIVVKGGTPLLGETENKEFLAVAITVFYAISIQVVGIFGGNLRVSGGHVNYDIISQDFAGQDDRDAAAKVFFGWLGFASLQLNAYIDESADFTVVAGIAPLPINELNGKLKVTRKDVKCFVGTGSDNTIFTENVRLDLDGTGFVHIRLEIKVISRNVGVSHFLDIGKGELLVGEGLSTVFLRALISNNFLLVIQLVEKIHGHHDSVAVFADSGSVEDLDLSAFSYDIGRDLSGSALKESSRKGSNETGSKEHG